MSRYCFIASDDGELPRVDHHAPDKKNRIVFKSFDEAEDLFIAKTPIKKTCEDVKYYTELPIVYVLAFGNDERRVSELIDYLQKNTKKGKKIRSSSDLARQCR